MSLGGDQLCGDRTGQCLFASIRRGLRFHAGGGGWHREQPCHTRSPWNSKEARLVVVEVPVPKHCGVALKRESLNGRERAEDLAHPQASCVALVSPSDCMTPGLPPLQNEDHRLADLALLALKLQDSICHPSAIMYGNSHCQDIGTQAGLGPEPALLRLPFL